ncbi:mercuric reductase [Roseiconus lacunae]|uniref:Mercuric reductase n=1 Tax=Roseiconus lacunae TaxID=2605694 RepID=A0ABT7PQ03_9BACT|nr:mercuric reductase [Roseiconus lacunae]MDM4018572.1 mercuric reductase [Roseiconus lacunae]
MNKAPHPIPALQPLDEYNQSLQSNVHPKDWTNPQSAEPYQLVVIGAGTAGLVTAAGAAGLGARVALIERSLMGGDCLNVGCVPSKAIIRSARVAASVSRAHQYGIDSGGDIQIDFSTVMRRMRRLRWQISPHDSAKRFSELGVDVYLGQATFTGGQSIQVTNDNEPPQTLQFRKAVIATGAQAVAPNIPGLDSVNYLTNETLFSITELPRRLGIIGAGPIGCEMAQAMARLGSQVVLIDRNDRVLPREDSDASEILRRGFEAEGIDLKLGAKNLSVRQSVEGIQFEFDSESRHNVITVDRLLVAAGRAPNIDGLGLDQVGVNHDERGVEVNDHLQTTNPNVYAAGDICSKLKFTHVADFQARIVIQNALFALGPIGRKRVSDLIVPRVTYTSPEVAQVGRSPNQSNPSETDLQTFTQSMSTVDRAILDGQDEGFVRVHVRQGTDRIVGATIVAENAGDLINEITMAMNSKIGLSRIASVIHPYPTQADAIRKLGDQFNRTKLTPLNQRLLRVLMKLNVGR